MGLTGSLARWPRAITAMTSSPSGMSPGQTESLRVGPYTKSPTFGQGLVLPGGTLPGRMGPQGDRRAIRRAKSRT